MKMSKDYAVVELEDGYITFMNKEYYGLCLCRTKILYESDDNTECYNKYLEFKK